MGSDENTGSSLFLKSAYYTGKLLHATDFIRDQNYGNSKLEFLNRKFHGWGIMEGLEVRPGRDGKLFLSRGSAIDPQGRILVAPENRLVKPEDIEGFQTEKEHDFVLGICYAERTLETERDHLKGEECYQPSVIAETYALHAFGMSEYRKLMSEAVRQESILTEEKVLYKSGAVELTVKIPKLVPEDSLFKIRIQVRTVRESNSSIGWHGMLKLQGAVFAHSGESGYMLEEEPVMCSGSLQREWDVCTEENRTLPVLLEINHLEIVTESEETAKVSDCQFQIETTSSYDQAVKGYLLELAGKDQSENWVPLACLRLGEAGRDTGNGKYAFSLIKKEHLRIYVSRPCEELILKRIQEENGILDIRWRKLLKHMWGSPVPPLPRPSAPPAPRHPLPPKPRMPLPPEGVLTEQQFWKLAEEDRQNRINRGIVVIPVPRRYKEGQVLFSEEISHGFPGEEIFLRCGRVWEEQSYAYWEREKQHYRIIHGDEELFYDVCDGQEIIKQAVLQNVEAGTFQVAVTLKKGRRRKRSKEVAISWIAVRSV